MQNPIKKSDNHGYVMILVMVVMGLVTALCLTLLVSASTLLSSARNAGQKEQCRILAISISHAIREQTEHFSYPSPPGSDSGTSDVSLQSKLQTIATTSWSPGEVITYHLDSEDLPGYTTVEFYWLDSSNSLTELDVSKTADMADAAEEFTGLRLYLTVTNTIGKDSSTITTVFKPVVSTRIVRTEGPDTNGDGKSDSRQERTVWTKWQWKYEGQSWEGEDNQ